MEKNKLTAVVEEYISDKEIFLVSIKISAGNVIEVVIDSMNGTAIDTCIELSKFVDSHFDRDVEDYELTVATASISEPFVMIEQYKKNIDREVEVWIRGEATGENKGVKKEGFLTEVNEDSFTLSYVAKVTVEGKKKKEEREFHDIINYQDVKSTKLVLKF